MTEFDAEAGAREQEKALTRVERAAPDDFKEEAMKIIHWVARYSESFTTDRVWYYIQKHEIPPPPEPRVLGALMRKAVTNGWIYGTARHVMSTKASNHRRPVRVWRSLIYEGAS